jgi:hypothetical protein
VGAGSMGTGKSRLEIPRDKTRRCFSHFRHCVRGILSLSLSIISNSSLKPTSLTTNFFHQLPLSQIQNLWNELRICADKMLET